MSMSLPEEPVASCTKETPLGPMTITVWEGQYGPLAQLQAPFIWEWSGVADDDLEEEETNSSVHEVWEDLNPYGWENLDEFPGTPQQWQDYLAWAIEEIVNEFEYRIEKHYRRIDPIARKYLKQNKRKPTAGWLLEHYPKASFFGRETKQFQLRVIQRVLEGMKDVPVQMQLF